MEVAMTIIAGCLIIYGGLWLGSELGKGINNKQKET